MEIERTEYDARQAAARKLARERGFSALVAWSRGGSTQDHYADVYYLTGFYTHQPFIPDEPGRWRAHGHTALVLPLDEPGTLLLDMTELQDPKPAADRVRFAENLVESLPGRSGLMRSHTSSVSSPRPATAVCLPVIHTEQEKNLPAVAVIHQTGPTAFVITIEPLCRSRSARRSHEHPLP